MRPVPNSPDEALEVVPLQRVRLGEGMRQGVPEPKLWHTWLYAGGLHTLQSEPGVAKTWLALWMAWQLINEDYSVVYIDEEGGQELVTERLVLLGSSPDKVDKLFHYFPFPERTWTAQDLEALAEACQEAQEAGQLAVGILDSLPDFLTAAGLNENLSTDVTGFVRKMLAVFRRTQSALLVLDHLTRQPDNEPRKRSRYARGSGAKLAKADLTILVESEKDFDDHTSGALNLWKTKDRRGRILLPTLRQPALALEVNVTPGHVEIVERQMAPAAIAPVWEGPTRAMESCLAWLRAHPGESFSTNQVHAAVIDFTTRKGFRKTTIVDALRALVNAEGGEVTTEAGPRNSVLYRCT